MTERRSPSDLFPRGQIRLAALSVYNWGSFHGLHTISIDPDGTLITGDNGSGKSTLVDGLMALLQPAGRAVFNVAAAQGDRSDRTLVSYVRGNFGSEHDGAHTRARVKREGPTVSAVRALYRADDGSETTLAAVFWLAQASSAHADLRRHYVVATRDLPLEALLTSFGNGDLRRFRQRLREDTTITSCDDRFGEYQEVWRRLLHLDNRNAPALLSRALGLKKIDDLTLLIRELVLEPSVVREDARAAVREFEDLRATHDRLVDARMQHQALAGLPETFARWGDARAIVGARDAELAGLPVYLAEQCATLWRARADRLDARLTELAAALEVADQRQRDAAVDVSMRHEEYLRLGGDRIERLRAELETARRRLVEVNERASRYQAAARALDLDPSLQRGPHAASQAAAGQALARAGEERAAAQDAFAAESAALGNLQARRRALQEEREETARRPDSNIDARYQRLRDEMVRALDIPKVRLPFLGELIDVAPAQRSWQGAIERALGGLRVTLAAPEASIPAVTRWLNTRHTGLHVRVQTARPVTGAVEFMPDGFLRKLEWRKHPYREWLKHHLARFDLACVVDTAALDQRPFSMTVEGLIHREAGRFEKRDLSRVGDRRDWALGFSNTARLGALDEDIAVAERELRGATARVGGAREAMDALDARLRHWERIRELEWADVDVHYWQQRVTELEATIAELTADDGSATLAMRRWDAAREALATIHRERDALVLELGQRQQDRERAARAIDAATEVASTGLEATVREALGARVGGIQDEGLDSVAQVEGAHRQALVAERERASRRVQELGQRAVGVVSRFRAQWPLIAGEWAADLDSVPQYLRHLHALIGEGLPELVEQFRERLNRHASQSLAGISQKMEAERDEIRERVEHINAVLRRTEFREGTYLRLQCRRDLFPHVRDFEHALRLVFEQATREDDEETRFAQLEHVISMLEKASNPTTAGTLESLRLLDPRYQMSFFAEEVGRDDEQVRDVLMSSSGKSGGEKEAFAGTIVAASLAYVLTPDGADRPVYCTVFLDEAFSNTAEAVSRRVLRVFKALEVHVNLITPFKNLNLARESARSLVIAERDMERHESRLCEVTWEEVDERLRAESARRLAEARALGVELESHG